MTIRKRMSARFLVALMDLRTGEKFLEVSESEIVEEDLHERHQSHPYPVPAIPT